MISLMFALIASPMAVSADQAVQATLQSCSMEGGRWVCRYAVPDIEIVPIPGSDIVANAPATILSIAPSPESGTTHTSPVTVPATTTAPATTGATPPTTGVATVEPGPIRPIDAGVLTENEARLVSRCADAGWMSLCLPDDRRAARSLRDKQNAYLAVRRDVTRLLGENQCQAAVRTALDGGYLALARETREYCTPATTPAPQQTRPVTSRPAPAPVVVPPAAAPVVTAPTVTEDAAKPAAD